MKMNRLTTLIGIALLLGVIVGYACNTLAGSPAQAKEIASYFGILTDIFLRLIKMIIAPLVFATLVAGLAGMGDSKTVGRIGAKALGWFVGASFCSLLLGLVFANLLQPGAHLGVPLPDVCRREHCVRSPASQLTEPGDLPGFRRHSSSTAPQGTA